MKNGESENNEAIFFWKKLFAMRPPSLLLVKARKYHGRLKS